MIGQAGVVGLHDLLMAGQELRQRHRVGIVSLHPDGQCLGAAQDEPRVHGTENRPFRVLHEPQPLDVIVAFCDHDAANAVAVPVEKLGRAVDDEVGAEVEGSLHERAGEGVVHDDEHPMRVGDLAGGRQIREAQHRIGRRLEEEHLRRRPEGRLDRAGV
jgi:hypothetical protein